MRPHTAALLSLALAGFASCNPDLPTATTTPQFVGHPGSVVRSQVIGQGGCAQLSTFPLVTTSGDLAGSVTTYWDDYSLYGVFQAAPGFRFVRTTFGVLEWIDIPYGIPFGPNGKVDFERFILQSRHDPPVEVVTHRVPMDLINDMLMVYSILPRAVMRHANNTLPPMWAGEQIPWPYDPEWQSDSAARYATITMDSPCLPRVTVLTDLNMFDNDGLSNNAMLPWNLLWAFEDLPARNTYPGAGTVLFDRGRESPCWRDGSCGDAALSSLRTLYTNIVGVGPSDIFSRSGTLTSIPAGVKLFFLWLPREVFTVAEINTLKQYVAAGGRVVFVTDRPDYYGAAGRRTLDQFLADMGSGAAAAPGTFECGGYHDIPLGTLPPHRLTERISSVRVRCTGAITTGQRDFILFRDASGEHVTGASVSVSTAPITEHQRVAAGRD